MEVLLTVGGMKAGGTTHCWRNEGWRYYSLLEEWRMEVLLTVGGMKAGGTTHC